MSTPLFPAFLKLAGRKVIVVGAGPVGASKIDALVTAGADVTVIAPDVVDAVADAPVRIERRRFRPSDLDGAWFAVAAAPPDVNREVGAAAEARHVFVNAVDDLANATAYLGGVRAQERRDAGNLDRRAGTGPGGPSSRRSRNAAAR